jgi:hypothetical protein
MWRSIAERSKRLSRQMPFKSKAQRRKFAELLMKGEISPETFEEWNRETGSATLPERVTPKKKGSGAKTKSKRGGSKTKRKAKRAPKRRSRRP